jgi:hypothetical protein
MSATVDSFKGKLKLQVIRLMKSVPTHFPSVQIRVDGTYDTSVCIIYIDKVLTVSEGKFKVFDCMKLTVSFVTNLFQEGDLSDRAERVCSVFKENVRELEPFEIINLQSDLPLKTGVNDTNFWNFVPPAQRPVLNKCHYS